MQPFHSPAQLLDYTNYHHQSNQALRPACLLPLHHENRFKHSMEMIRIISEAMTLAGVTVKRAYFSGGKTQEAERRERQSVMRTE